MTGIGWPRVARVLGATLAIVLVAACETSPQPEERLPERRTAPSVESEALKVRNTKFNIGALKRETEILDQGGRLFGSRAEAFLTLGNLSEFNLEMKVRVHFLYSDGTPMGAQTPWKPLTLPPMGEATYFDEIDNVAEAEAIWFDIRRR